MICKSNNICNSADPSCSPDTLSDRAEMKWNGVYYRQMADVGDVALIQFLESFVQYTREAGATM